MSEAQLQTIDLSSKILLEFFPGFFTFFFFFFFYPGSGGGWILFFCSNSTRAWAGEASVPICGLNLNGGSQNSVLP